MTNAIGIGVIIEECAHQHGTRKPLSRFLAFLRCDEVRFYYIRFEKRFAVSAAYFFGSRDGKPASRWVGSRL